MPGQPRALRIKPNLAKIREAIIHLISEGDARQYKLTQFEIAKALFLADQAHLNRYGRPITFDHYVAMKDGPVPSLAYDLLKNEPRALKAVGLEEPLWRVRKTLTSKNYYTEAHRTASDEVLSESDTEELSDALTFVLKTGYKGVWEMVHKHPAYLDAWAKRGDRGQHPIDYTLLFADPNRAAAEELEYTSAHA